MLPQLNIIAMNKVIVMANEAGQVVVPSKNNPEFGYLRVTESTTVIDSNGWLRPVTKSALIRGKVSDLTGLGWKAGQALAGQIVVKESLEPTNPSNLEQDKKIAGDTGIACTLGGQPIYRTSVYTTDMEATDTLIAHDNGEAISLARAQSEEKADLG